MSDWFDDEEEQEMPLSDLIGLIQEYEKAQSEERTLNLDEDSFEQIIQFYIENREFKRALSVADSAIERFPFSPAFFILKAEVLADQSLFEDALKNLRIAETLDAQEITVYLIRADIYLWSGQHTDALKQLELALPMAIEKEDFTDIYLLQADIHEDLELYLEVIDALEMAVAIDPDNEEPLNRLWYAVEIAETFERSEKFHKKLTDLYPYNYLVWFNLGHALYYQNRYEEALEAFGYVTAINESFEPAHIFAGDVHFEMGNFEKALECYHEAISAEKPYKESYFKLGECYEKLGDYQKMRYYLRKATNIDAEYEEAHHKIGESYMVEENYAQAIQSFERALKLLPESANYLSSLGDALLMNDEPEKSLECFVKAIDIEPNNHAHYIHLGSAYFEMGDFANCIETFTHTITLFPEASDIRYIFAVYLFQMDKRKEALRIVEEALNINTQDAVLIFKMDETLAHDADLMALLSSYNI
jgi:tetratricopeptide (TPR) repeat protein